MEKRNSNFEIKILQVCFDDKFSSQIIRIRHDVFTVEQQIDDKEDLDGKDPSAIQILAYFNEKPVGTARMETDGHIGRLAVLKDYRNNQIGSKIVNALITEAKTRKLNSVYLGAQLSATKFYKKLGFKHYGEIFLEVEIDHIMMRKAL